VGDIPKVVELEEIQRVRGDRDEVAHELSKLLGERDLVLNLEFFFTKQGVIRENRGLVDKKLRGGINPEFGGVETNDANIRPGRMVILDYLVLAAFSGYL